MYNLWNLPLHFIQRMVLGWARVFLLRRFLSIIHLVVLLPALSHALCTIPKQQFATVIFIFYIYGILIFFPSLFCIILRDPERHLQQHGYSIIHGDFSKHLKGTYTSTRRRKFSFLTSYSIFTSNTDVATKHHYPRYTHTHTTHTTHTPPSLLSVLVFFFTPPDQFVLDAVSSTRHRLRQISPVITAFMPLRTSPIRNLGSDSTSMSSVHTTFELRAFINARTLDTATSTLPITQHSEN